MPKVAGETCKAGHIHTHAYRGSRGGYRRENTGLAARLVRVPTASTSLACLLVGQLLGYYRPRDKCTYPSPIASSDPPVATYQSTYHLHLSRLQNRIIPPVRLSHPKGRLSRQVDYLTPKTDYHARSIITLERPIITPGRLSDHHNNELSIYIRVSCRIDKKIWANSKLRIQCWVKLP